MKLVILGESHTVAVARGLRQLIGSGALDPADDVRALKVLTSELVLSPFFEETRGRIRFLDEKARAALTELIGHDSFTPEDSGTIFAFSFGFHVYSLLLSPDWTTFSPWIDAERSGGRQLVSNGVVRAIGLAKMRHVVEFYRAVRRMGLRCLAISSPPLMQGDRRLLPLDAPPNVVLHLNAQCRAAMIETLAELDVPTVLAPKRAHLDNDPRRWRRPQYGSYKGEADMVHANAAFGRLMIPRIIAAARTLNAAG